MLRLLPSCCRQAKEPSERLKHVPNPLNLALSAWLQMYSHSVSQLRILGCVARRIGERAACQPWVPEGQLGGPVLAQPGNIGLGALDSPGLSSHL